MNRRRQLAVAFFSGVIIIVLAAIVYVANVNASQTVDVWVVQADVHAGTKFDATTVAIVPIKAEPQDFAYSEDQPDGSQTFGVNMERGDIVRKNDLVKTSDLVPFNVGVKGTPAVATGDFIDVYAQVVPGGSQASTATVVPPPTRIAHAVPVQAVAGGAALTVLIPLRLTSAWVAIAADPSVALWVVKVPNGPPVNTLPFLNIDQVIQFLAQSSGASGGGGSTTSPSPSPS